MSCWMALLFISKLGPTQEWNATWFFVFVFFLFSHSYNGRDHFYCFGIFFLIEVH